MSELEPIITATLHCFVFDGVDIRAFDIEGSRFVVGSDVCKALGIGNPSDAMSRLDADDKITLCRSDTLVITKGIWEHFAPQVQSIVLVTDGGVADLFQSLRPKDFRFQDWFSDQATVSPFDTIRKTRADGSEFWSARDLMPLMGYSMWHHFETPIRRAMKTAENQGMDVAALFTRSREKTGGRPREDFEMVRYAAYLVAMNGDPNIPEVAAAQHYFAVKTREAETTRLALTDDEIVHKALAITAARVESLTARVQELEPKGRAYDQFIDSRDALPMKLAGEYLGWGQNQLLARLRAEKILRSGGPSHNLPYARYDQYFHVVPFTIPTKNGQVLHKAQTCVWPDTLDWLVERIGMGPRKPRPRG